MGREHPNQSNTTSEGLHSVAWGLADTLSFSVMFSGSGDGCFPDIISPEIIVMVSWT